MAARVIDLRMSECFQALSAVFGGKDTVLGPNHAGKNISSDLDFTPCLAFSTECKRPPAHH